MAEKFTNNASTKLASSIVAADVALTVTTGDGALFPSLSGSDYFLCTLVSSTAREIVKVTARSVDAFTIVRAQEGTTAASFAAGDTVELRATAGTLDNFMQLATGALTSAQLAAALTDETGSGVAVFGTAPTLSNPVVGTQSAHDASTKAASTAYVDAPEQWVALTDGATITWDVGSRREAKAKVTLGGNRTLSITNAANGSAGVLKVTQDGTGSRGLTLPSGSIIVGGGGTTAPLSTAAGAVDVLAFEYDGTTWLWTIGKAAA